MSREQYDSIAADLIRKYRAVVDDSCPVPGHTNIRATELSAAITEHAKNFDPSWYRPHAR